MPWNTKGQLVTTLIRKAKLNLWPTASKPLVQKMHSLMDDKWACIKGFLFQFCDIKILANISKILAKLVGFPIDIQNFPEFPNLMLKNQQNMSKIKSQLKAIWDTQSCILLAITSDSKTWEDHFFGLGRLEATPLPVREWHIMAPRHSSLLPRHMGNDLTCQMLVCESSSSHKILKE